MIALDIPGFGLVKLSHLVLDVNGVLALDGDLLPTVPARIAALRRDLEVHLASADTYGRLEAIAQRLGVHAFRLEAGRPEAKQKAIFVQTLGASGVVAIGNGNNDTGMLAAAAVGIAVLGQEGLATAALLAANVVAGSIEDALDLLLQPRRLLATLRS